MSEQDNSILRLQNALATLAEFSSQHNERISNAEQAIQILLELQRTASDRADDHLAWINQLGSAQAETNEKMTALISAQAEMNEKVTALIDAQMRSDERFERFSEASDEKFERFSEALARLAEAQARAEEAFAAAMARIAESQERTDRRLEELAGVVRGGRGESSTKE